MVLKYARKFFDIPPFKRVILIPPHSWMWAVLSDSLWRNGILWKWQCVISEASSQKTPWLPSLALFLISSGRSRLPCCEHAPGKSPGGEILRSPVTVSTLSVMRVDSKADPQTLDKPSDDSSPGWHLHCNLIRDTKSHLSSQATPEYLIYRNCKSY